MLPIKHLVHLHTLLCYLLAFTLAKDDPDYDPSSNYRPRNVTGLGDFYGWVGSYYNATAEVKLETAPGNKEEGPMCSKLENYTTTFKFDAILSILERGPWNAGSNSVIIWLTLLPQTSPPFNVSTLGADFMYRGSNLSNPVFSVSPTPNGYWRPKDGAGPDIFNFTTSQIPGGAYNISGSMRQLGDAGSSSSWGNFTLPVCNNTYLNGDYNMGMSTYKWWNMEDWDDFRYPHLGVQFDEKTANLTLDGVFYATPYVQSSQTIYSSPTLGGPPVRGFIRVRFLGTLDTYHSDSLSVNVSSPSWSRTVGFRNDSSNIGYEDTGRNLRNDFVVSLIVVVLIALLLL